MSGFLGALRAALRLRAARLAPTPATFRDPSAAGRAARGRRGDFGPPWIGAEIEGPFELFKIADDVIPGGGLQADVTPFPGELIGFAQTPANNRIHALFGAGVDRADSPFPDFSEAHIRHFWSEDAGRTWNSQVAPWPWGYSFGTCVVAADQERLYAAFVGFDRPVAWGGGSGITALPPAGPNPFTPCLFPRSNVLLFEGSKVWPGETSGFDDCSGVPPAPLPGFENGYGIRITVRFDPASPRIGSVTLVLAIGATSYLFGPFSADATIDLRGPDDLPAPGTPPAADSSPGTTRLFWTQTGADGITWQANALTVAGDDPGLETPVALLPPARVFYGFGQSLLLSETPGATPVTLDQAPSQHFYGRIAVASDGLGRTVAAYRKTGGAQPDQLRAVQVGQQPVVLFTDDPAAQRFNVNRWLLGRQSDAVLVAEDEQLAGPTVENRLRRATYSSSGIWGPLDPVADDVTLAEGLADLQAAAFLRSGSQPRILLATYRPQDGTRRRHLWLHKAEAGTSRLLLETPAARSVSVLATPAGSSGFPGGGAAVPPSGRDLYVLLRLTDYDAVGAPTASAVYIGRVRRVS